MHPMDPVLVLLTGGILLLMSLSSLAWLHRCQQCPGCLDTDFLTDSQKRADPQTGIAYRVCRRCGCTVECGELDKSGNVRWSFRGQGRVVDPQWLAAVLGDTVPIEEDGVVQSHAHFP